MIMYLHIKKGTGQVLGLMLKVECYRVLRGSTNIISYWHDPRDWGTQERSVLPDLGFRV